MTELGQKRTRTACGPCHRRKRKCDGLDPCSTCGKDNYRCYYGSHSKVQAVDIPTPTSNKSAGPSDPQDGTQERSQMVNSGIIFVRQLLMEIDPKNAPKSQLSAWNIGSRAPLVTELPRPVSTILHLLTHTQMTALAYVYFEKVDPCYGFVDRSTIFQQINSRWLTRSNLPEPTDATLCGIAALGSYFSKALAVPVESELMQLAKSLLDSASPSKAPDVNIVTAWVCRVVYLRLTSAPFAAWIASCTTMHVLEAAGVHLDAHKDETILTRISSKQSPHTLRRAFGVAQHLNTWISYDLGLSRVSLRSPAVAAAPSNDPNYTDKLLELLPVSLGLDHAETQTDGSLRSMLATIVAKIDEQPPLIMAQCNLLLCILRRLCAQNSLRRNDDGTLNSALRFLGKGLHAASQMVEDDCPWHHLANVPFQTLCMLLAIDTPASLNMVEKAMLTLQKVTQAYNTVTLNEAYSTARLILALHRRRRYNDAQIIENVLSKLSVETPTSNIDPGVYDWAAPTEAEILWINDLMSDFPGLQNLDVGDMFNDLPSDG
ncbi:hypothetical protein RBB50_002168 [Rhinocladiella similis]